MIIHIKYMVSLRCKLKVIEVLNKLGMKYIKVDLGTVELFEDITKEQYDKLDKELRLSGLELLDDKKSILIKDIKCVVVEMINNLEILPNINYSDYISDKLTHDYTYLANLFMEVNGITLYHFIIIHKIEKVKELLLYDELTLTEISYRLHYSSVQYLSRQFKMITGTSTSEFIKLKYKRMKYLENV